MKIIFGDKAVENDDFQKWVYKFSKFWEKTFFPPQPEFLSYEYRIINKNFLNSMLEKFWMPDVTPAKAFKYHHRYLIEHWEATYIHRAAQAVWSHDVLGAKDYLPDLICSAAIVLEYVAIVVYYKDSFCTLDYSGPAWEINTYVKELEEKEINNSFRSLRVEDRHYLMGEVFEMVGDHKLRHPERKELWDPEDKSNFFNACKLSSHEITKIFSLVHEAYENCLKEAESL